MLTCLVLGGGLGTRLGSLTSDLPKPLVPVAGVPFVRHQLGWLASEGVTDVVYSIGHLGHLIRAELDHADLGCAVRFVDEGTSRLGTGGAVRLAVEEGLLDERFFVLYGDSYLQIDVAEVERAYLRSGASALMTVFENRDDRLASNVVYERGRVLRYDKDEPDPHAAGMAHIDYGLSALSREAVEQHIAAGERADLADVFRDLSARGDLAGFEAEHRFFEMGSPEGLAELEAHLGVGAP